MSATMSFLALYQNIEYIWVCYDVVPSALLKLRKLYDKVCYDGIASAPSEQSENSLHEILNSRFKIKHSRGHSSNEIFLRKKIIFRNLSQELALLFNIRANSLLQSHSTTQ